MRVLLPRLKNSSNNKSSPEYSNCESSSDIDYVVDSNQQLKPFRQNDNNEIASDSSGFADPKNRGKEIVVNATQSLNHPGQQQLTGTGISPYQIQANKDENNPFQLVVSVDQQAADASTSLKNISEDSHTNISEAKVIGPFSSKLGRSFESSSSLIVHVTDSIFQQQQLHQSPQQANHQKHQRRPRKRSVTHSPSHANHSAPSEIGNPSSPNKESIPNRECSPTSKLPHLNSFNTFCLGNLSSLPQNHVKRQRSDSKPAAKVLYSNEKLASQLSTPIGQGSIATSGGRVLSANSVENMTGGGRRRCESDDDSTEEAKEPWINSKSRRPGKRSIRHQNSVQLLLTPAENEPPPLDNHHPVRVIDVSSLENSGCARKPVPDPDKSCSTSRQVTGNDVLSRFKDALKKRGLEIAEQDGDGNCLFRAVSLQVYGDSDQHAEVRERCLDFMASNEEHYSNFVAATEVDEYHGVGESFSEYINRKRQLGVHGNHAEIQAISELYNRPVEVYTPEDVLNASTRDDGKLQPLNIFHAEYKTSDVPIRLSYHDGNHYNAIIDPFVPTAGLGLGLPGLQPGLADKMQVAAAVTESDKLADQMDLEHVLKQSAKEHDRRSAEDEDDDLQRALKESAFTMDYLDEQKAMALSDLDATNLEIEQEVLAESWDSYGRQEQGRKQQASPILSGGRRRPFSNLPTYSESGSSVASAAALPVSNGSAFASASVPLSSSVAFAVTETAPVPRGSSELYADELSTEYPQTVQELVMNGFELKRVLHAYELVGDNFDDLLAFLISTSNSHS